MRQVKYSSVKRVLEIILSQLTRKVETKYVKLAEMLSFCALRPIVFLRLRLVNGGLFHLVFRALTFERGSIAMLRA